MIRVADICGQRMDCCAAVSLALRRMGITVAPDAFTSAPDLWHAVTDDVRTGDVIVSRPGGRLHVAAVLDARAGHGVAFTADARTGACTMPLSRAMADRVGVWRYIAPATPEVTLT